MTPFAHFCHVSLCELISYISVRLSKSYQLWTTSLLSAGLCVCVCACVCVSVCVCALVCVACLYIWHVCVYFSRMYVGVRACVAFVCVCVVFVYLSRVCVCMRVWRLCVCVCVCVRRARAPECVHQCRHACVCVYW